MFYRLHCGCIVLVVERREQDWLVIDIDRCDADTDSYVPWIGDIHAESLSPEGRVGCRKIEDGSALDPDSQKEYWGKLRGLVYDGHRYREIRRVLDPARDLRA